MRGIIFLRDDVIRARLQLPPFRLDAVLYAQHPGALELTTEVDSTHKAQNVNNLNQACAPKCASAGSERIMKKIGHTLC